MAIHRGEYELPLGSPLNISCRRAVVGERYAFSFCFWDSQRQKMDFLALIQQDVSYVPMGLEYILILALMISESHCVVEAMCHSCISCPLSNLIFLSGCHGILQSQRGSWNLLKLREHFLLILCQASVGSMIWTSSITGAVINKLILSWAGSLHPIWETAISKEPLLLSLPPSWVFPTQFHPFTTFPLPFPCPRMSPCRLLGYLLLMASRIPLAHTEVQHPAVLASLPVLTSRKYDSTFDMTVSQRVCRPPALAQDKIGPWINMCPNITYYNFIWESYRLGILLRYFTEAKFVIFQFGLSCFGLAQMNLLNTLCCWHKHKIEVGHEKS